MNAGSALAGAPQVGAGMRDQNPAYAAALEHIARGWAVFPCEPRGKRPLGSLVPNGLHDATVDPEVVTLWWGWVPTANGAVVTGNASGLLVLDVDGGEGVESVLDLQRRHGALPRTLWSKTGRGWQAWFASTDGIGNSAGKLGPGLDVRGGGGYVIAPGSTHPNGHRYCWADRRATLAPPPAWLLELLRPKVARTSTPIALPSAKGYAAAAVNAEALIVRSTPRGGRNAQLNASSYSLGTLVGSGQVDEHSVRQALLDAARAAGLGEVEAQRTISSGLSAGMRNPRSTR